MEYEKLVWKVLNVLEKNKIETIVVGGYPWEHAGIPVGTLDLDLMVLSKEYEQTVKDLPRILEGGDFSASEIEYHPIMSLFRVNDKLEVELINSQYYTTRKRRFYEYVKQYRTWTQGGVYYGDLELVWYMRLFLDDWQPYMVKCLRDAFALYSTKKQIIDLGKIRDIAKAMGSEKKIKPRLKSLRELLRKRGLNNPKQQTTQK